MSEQGTGQQEELPSIYRQPAQRTASGPNIVLGVIGAAIGAIVGAGIWMAVTHFSGWEIGYVAVGVGALAGWGAVTLGRGASLLLGKVAAVAGLAGILLGSYGNFYLAVHSTDLKEAIASDFEESVAQDEEYQKLSPAQRVEALEQAYAGEIATYSYIDSLKDSPKDLGFLVLFGGLGLYYGHRMGCGAYRHS